MCSLSTKETGYRICHFVALPIHENVNLKWWRRKKILITFTSVVEAVSDFMSDDYSDSSEIHGPSLQMVKFIPSQLENTVITYADLLVKP